jgi:cyclopropane fatty-acyl-phospholipid synthase-like methyltransferase
MLCKAQRRHARQVFPKPLGGFFIAQNFVIEWRYMAEYKKGWGEYYQITKAKPPRKLLVEALEYVVKKDKAIDIGAGALRDTKYLLERGFDVTAVDQSPLIVEMATEISSDKLHAIVSSYADLAFPKEAFDLASAMYALPFNPPESFDEMFKRVKGSLVKGGIFCGQLFGDHDEWKDNSKMTFHTSKEAKELFSDMEMIKFEEKEEDDFTANGTAKHWHFFNIIARKV